MKTSAGFDFKELVDVAELQKLTDNLYAATSIPSAIITMDGEVLTGSGWQRICTDFHRQHPDTNADCITSDTIIHKKISEGDEYAIYECPRGLVDASAPVIIEGEHVANVFAGQLFTTPHCAEKEKVFREAARKYGFDEEDYLKAYREIPILSEDCFKPILSFLSRFARLVATIGLARLRELEVAETINHNERKYLRLLQSTRTVPWEIDLATSKFTFMGAQAEELFGYPLSYWKDMEAWSQSVHPEDREWACTFCESETVKGKDHDFTYRMLTSDGRCLWIQDVITVIMGADGPERLVGFMHDVTAHKKAEMDRETLESQLLQSQKMEAIGTMAGGIAHDFNNMLAIIIGNIDILQHKENKDSPPGENIEHIRNAASRAQNLIKQILTFSRQEKPSLVLVDFSAAISEALKLLRSTIPTTVEIVIAVDEGDVLINADTTQLQQVLINLCTNAAHAMNEKGQLRVKLEEVALVDGGLPAVTDRPTGRFARLSISDSGSGMDKTTIDKIFDPFFTTKDVGEGTGMGLSVVHGIVEQHGGFITVDSTLGQGTIFNLYFPIADKNEAKELKADRVEMLPTGSERILFVDDEECIAYTCNELLECQGYRVTSVTSSSEALGIFRANPEKFDLVFTDQAMPDISGEELATEMLKIRPDIPIILCSGYSAKVSEADAREIGIRKFCMKPMDMKQLAIVARKVLDERGASL